MDNSTWSPARMNMILHGHETAEIWKGNTLAAPHFKAPDETLKTFDYIVANPPSPPRRGLRVSIRRTPSSIASIAASRRRRTATTPFLLHAINSLNSGGKAAVILPHGVFVPRAPRGPHFRLRALADAILRTHPSDLPTGSFWPDRAWSPASIHTILLTDFPALSGHSRAILEERTPLRPLSQPGARIE